MFLLREVIVVDKSWGTEINHGKSVNASVVNGTKIVEEFEKEA